jgi:hypothetical protein
MTILRRPVSEVPRDLSPKVNEAVSDDRRQEFIEALDRSDLDLTPWEADFVANHLNRCGGFSYKQALRVDELLAKYGPRLGFAP